MYGAIASDECYVQIGGQEIKGVTSITPSFNRPLSQYGNLGAARGALLSSGPVANKVAITRNLIYTGSTYDLLNMDTFVGVSTSGRLRYDAEELMFTDAYTTSFSMSCAVGEIPTVNNELEIYGKFENSLGPAPSVVGSIVLPAVRNISLVAGTHASTNRVTSFSLSKKANIKPLYGLGNGSRLNWMPARVDAMNPIEVEASFNFEVDDMEVEDAFTHLTQQRDNYASTLYDCQVLIQDFAGTETIFSGFAGTVGDGNYATLVSKELSVGIDDVVKATATFKWHEFSVV